MNRLVMGLLDNLASHIRFARAWLRHSSARFERNVILKGDVRRLSLGQRVVIQSGTVVHLGGMDWCERTGHVSIGDDSTISPNCVLYGAGPGGITIGRRFDCGPLVGIYASRTDYRNAGRHVFAGVVIGDDVVVFSHVVIGPGVTIGDRAVVAAGSVVLEDVPADSFVAGAPAKVVRRSLQ